MDRLINFMYELDGDWAAPIANLTVLRKVEFLGIDSH